MSNLFDTAAAPTSEPREIIAGNFVRWRRNDLAADYPVATHELKYVCRSEGSGTLIEITATEADGKYQVQIASATSNSYTPGIYHWSAFITRTADSERVEVDSGAFTVRANPQSSSADPASFAKRMLTLIEDAIEGRATNYQLDTLSYSLGSETSASRDPAQLLVWRTKFRSELRRLNQIARAKKGQSHGGKIQARL